MDKRELEKMRAYVEGPCASYWLRDAVEASKRRDVVDALHDAEFLAEYLRVKYEMEYSSLLAEVMGQ